MYKIGDKFIASRNFPFGIDEVVERGEDRHDLTDGEEFKIIKITSDGLYKVYNTSCDCDVFTLMTDEDIALVISE